MRIKNSINPREVLSTLYVPDTGQNYNLSHASLFKFCFYFVLLEIEVSFYKHMRPFD